MFQTGQLVATSVHSHLARVGTPGPYQWRDGRREMDRKSAYKQKLLDPRWQKKRLEILERDGWTGQMCGSKEKTLHVHHVRYQSGDPWETDSDLLLTSCWECHEAEHESHKDALDYLLCELGSIGIRSSFDLVWMLETASQYLHTVSGGVPGDQITKKDRAVAFGEALEEFEEQRASAIERGEWYR